MNLSIFIPIASELVIDIYDRWYEIFLNFWSGTQLRNCNFDPLPPPPALYGYSNPLYWLKEILRGVPYKKTVKIQKSKSMLYLKTIIILSFHEIGIVTH